MSGFRTGFRSGFRGGFRSPFGASAAPDPILALFSAGQQGSALKIYKVETLFQEAALTTPSADTDPVGGIEDQSGNDKHATQVDAAKRPARDDQRIIVDGEDDNMGIDFTGSGGFSATLLHGTSEGVVEAKVNVPNGVWDFYDSPTFQISDNVTGLVLVEGTPNVSAAKAEIPGAGNKFAGVTSMQEWFRGRTDITEIASGDWDTSSVTDFIFFANGCSSLTTITTESGTGNPFADSPNTNYTNAFANTSLNQASIDNILVRIEQAGTSNGTFDQSGGSAPSATGETAIDALRGRGWTIAVTGGY